MTSYTSSLSQCIDNLHKNDDDVQSYFPSLEALISIQSWNNDIEKAFQTNTILSKPSSSSSTEKVISIQEVAKKLHQTILSLLIEYRKLSIYDDDNDGDDINAVDKAVSDFVSNSRNEININSQNEMNTNATADTLLIKIVHEIQNQHNNIVKINHPTNENANDGFTPTTIIIQNNLRTHESKWNILYETLSEVIRACKHVLRLNRTLLKEKKLANRRNTNTNRTSANNTNREEEGESKDLAPNEKDHVLLWNTICGIDSCHQLCTIGMIKLYLVLLEINSTPLYTKLQQQQQQQQQQPQQQEQIQKIEPKTLYLRDNLAKQSCITLFHSTNSSNGGGDASTANDPISKKGLQALITPKSNVYGIPILVRLLMTSTSTQLMLVLIKFLHSLVGTVSGIMVLIDAEVKTYYMQQLKQSELVDDNDDGSSQQPQKQQEPNMVSILVSTLAWSIRSNPTSTTTMTPTNDACIDIAIEIIRVLFAIQNRHRSYYKQISDNDTPTMTQLGILIIDILHLPNNTHPKFYECKSTVVILLIDAPTEYTHFLYLNQSVSSLMRLLWIQLNQIVIENEGMVQGQASAASILPILIVLNKLSLSHAEMKRCIKDEIFPPPSDKINNKMDDSNDNNERKQEEGNQEYESISSGAKSNNINPIDAPQGTIRWKLIKLMTWTESNVKRCASELIWTLCDGNSKEFVKRTGFGNAVHMLGIRGLVSIPKSNNS